MPPPESFTLRSLEEVARRWIEDIEGLQRARGPNLIHGCWDFGRDLGSFPVFVSPHVPHEHLGHWIDTIRVTRQPRSKRLWKKLRQRRQRHARPIMEPQAVRIGSTFVLHPKHAAALRQEGSEQ